MPGLRITSGTLKGRTLHGPADARVRPTSDKVRQAIFNILAHNDFDTGFVLEDAAGHRSVRGHGRARDRGDLARRSIRSVRGRCRRKPRADPAKMSKPWG